MSAKPHKTPTKVGRPKEMEDPFRMTLLMPRATRDKIEADAKESGAGSMSKHMVNVLNAWRPMSCEFVDIDGVVLPADMIPECYVGKMRATRAPDIGIVLWWPSDVRLGDRVLTKKHEVLTVDAAFVTSGAEKTVLGVVYRTIKI